MSHRLEIDSVNVSFGRNRVLTDIYLKCETGDIVGLLGRNGSGKSTLLRVLFGTEAADQKFIRIDGKKIDRPYQIPGEAGYLPQEPFLPRYMKLDTAVNLYLPGDRARLFFDDTLLFRFRRHKVSRLSGGELRYAEIKLLLHTDVKFLLLDEPFNGISPLIVESVKEMIRRSAQHKGIILTDHDYRNVLDVAGRPYLLSDGGLKSIENKDDLVFRGYISASAAQALKF